MNFSRHNAAQKDYFQTADHPTILPQVSAYVKRHVDRVLAAAGLQPGARLLEVGAGLGRFSWLLREHGFAVTACDISPELIASLRERYPDIPAFVGDACDLPADEGGGYDAVVGFFMLHHLPDLTATFRSLASQLRPGGRLVFCEPNAWYLPFYAQILLTPGMRWRVDKGVMNMRASVLSPALEAAGLSQINYRHYGFLPPGVYNRDWGRGLDHGLERLPLPARSRAFQIITAQHGD